MDAKKLYIIGNGFDLHHKVQSQYSNFKAFVREADSDLFEWVEQYVPAGDDWSALESALADILVENVVDDCMQFLTSYAVENWSDSGHHDYQYEVGRIAEGLSGRLQEVFGQWVRQIAIPTTDLIPNKLKSLDLAGFYLNFNYTSTLRVIYNIPPERILHIHGEAAIEGEDLVLGHAWAPEERSPLHVNDDPDQDHRITEGFRILDRYFEDTFKHSGHIIEANSDFFAELDSVEQVLVLGHSLSRVDREYFTTIVAGLKGRKIGWTIAVRKPDYYKEKQALLAQLGVPLECIQSKLWTEI